MLVVHGTGSWNNALESVSAAINEEERCIDIVNSGYYVRGMLTISVAAEAVRRASSHVDDGVSAVIGTDDSGTILYWSEAGETLYGWRSAEALGRNVLDVTPALQSVARAERIMGELLAGNPWSGVFMVRHRDGTPIIVDVTDTPVTHLGVVVGIVGVSNRTEPTRTKP